MPKADDGSLRWSALAHWSLTDPQSNRIANAASEILSGRPRQIYPSRSGEEMKTTVDAHIYSDAATGKHDDNCAGVGVVIIFDNGSVHTWAQKELQGASINALEMRALRHSAAIALQFRLVNPIFHVDSQVVRDQVRKGFASSWLINADLQFVLECYKNPNVVWIPSEENFADEPSRKVITQ